MTGLTPKQVGALIAFVASALQLYFAFRKPE